MPRPLPNTTRRSWATVALAGLWMILFSNSSTPGWMVEATMNNLQLLMVGNSFSEAHNMEELIQSMLNERKVVLQANSVFAARFEEGGMNLTHLAHADSMERTIADRHWTWVVLQEQSQTPGFYPPSDLESTWDYSLQSVLLLDRDIQAVGGTTILFETWGYFRKDPYNPTFYTDYQTMQDRITRGYEIYRETILKNNPQAKVKIAPAGLAFNRIFQQIQNDQDDPLAEGSLFSMLFEEEEDPRKHPSVYGSYLCGCVLFQTLTGLDVRQSSVDPFGMDTQLRKLLQQVAYDTVIEYNGGESKGKKYVLPPSTPAPYVPSDTKEYSSSTGKSGGGGGGGFVRSFFSLALIVGVGMFGWSRRGDIMRRVPAQVFRVPGGGGGGYQPPSQGAYGFEPVSNGANMELSDYGGGGAHHSMLG